MTNVLQPGVKEARRAARLQRREIAEQKQIEKLRLAEQEDEVRRRKLLAKAGGRRSLIASQGGALASATPKAQTDTLGG